MVRRRRPVCDQLGGVHLRHLHLLGHHWESWPGHLSWTVVHSVEETTILMVDPTVRPGECTYLKVIFTIFRVVYKCFHTLSKREI